jgi:hypothetical protein
MRRRDLSKVIFASAAGSMMSASARAADNTAHESRTRAESEAGITPSDPRYAPGDVRRYGARGDGLTNDVPAFQAAIDVARRANRANVYGPAGAAGTVYIPAPEAFYLLAGDLNCTFDGTANQHGILIRGESGLSPGGPAIIARHTGHVFDLTGCDSAVFENLNIGTDSQTNPQTCFFLARNRSRGSAGFHRFRNVRVNGKFTAAILYNYGSEGNVCSECVWYNESAAPGTKVAVFSSHNILKLKSAFIATALGAQSCLDHQVLGGEFVNASGDAAADVLYLDTVNSLKVFGPWMCAGIQSPGRALIYVDSTNGASSLVELYGLQGEVGATQQYGIYFGGERANTATGWTISGCYLPNAKYAIFCTPSTTLDNFHISGLRERVLGGLSAGVVQNSTISAGALPLSIGTSRRNTLIGDSSRWMIGTREHDFWIDSGAARKTWYPVTDNLKVLGHLTISEASCVFHGPLVTIGVTLTATTSVECAAGAALTGLPAVAVAKSSQVHICDGNTGEALGMGMVAGGNIRLPAIAPRQSVVIGATYFVA